MLKIDDLLSNNFAAYPENVRGYLEKFADNLREALKNDLIQSITWEMLKDAENNKEEFMAKLSNILNNGFKGYNGMSTKALLDLYLTVKRQEDFAQLIEIVSNKLEKEY